MRGSRGGGVTGGPNPPPPKKNNNNKNIGFSSNTGPDPLTNHKAALQIFNVGPSAARQRNAILMAFRWMAHFKHACATIHSVPVTPTLTDSWDGT